MKNIVETIRKLPNLLSLKAVSERDIVDAEIRLRVGFASEYREYLAAFGAVLADGMELSGITKADYRNVVTLTKEAWRLNPQVPHKMYVVEDLHVDGILIWQDTNGTIYQTVPGGEPRKIAGSLSEYIEGRLK